MATSIGIIATLASALVAVAVLYFNKRLVSIQPVTIVVRTMYLVAWISSLLVGLVLGGALEFNPLIIGLGFLNAMGAFMLFFAINQTLAKTAVIAPQKQIIAMGLSALVFGEWRLFDPRSLSGFILIIGVSVTILATVLFGSSSEEKKGQAMKYWLPAVLGVVFLVGTIEFLMKYFAVNGISSPVFLVSWYTGSFAGAVLVDCIIKRNWRWDGLRNHFILYLCVGIGMVVSLGLSFFSLGRIPAAVFFPLFTFTITIGGALVGFIFFNEHRAWRTRDWIGFGMGILGVVFLIVSTSWQ